MKSFRVCVFLTGLTLLSLGCGGGKKVVLLEQKADSLEARLAKLQNERDALSLDKTLQKAELDIVRRDLNKLRAANDSLQALTASPAVAEKAEPPPTPAETPSLEAETPAKPETIAAFQMDSVGVGIRQLLETSTLPAEPADLEQAPAPPPEDLPVVRPGADFQRGYDQALALFKEKRYTDSAQSFTVLLESNRNHRLAGNCQYWIGECLYAQNKYSDALAEFEKVFVYPNNFKADAAQFKIALCYLQMSKREEARAEFSRLIAAYPGSDFVARAQSHLDKLP